MLTLLALAAALAADPGTPQPLFNGKDLTGWVNVNCAPDTFTVKDGEIRCTGKPTGVLRTAKAYRNFVFEMDWMHEKAAGNSGLFIWSDPLTAKGQPFTRSIEVQVMLTDDVKDKEGRLLYTGQGDIFAIHGAKMVPDRPHPAGWSRCLPSGRFTKGAGEWNHYKVTAKDGTLKLEINGKEVSGGRDMSPREGHICLESEGSPIRFRNLTIAPLPDDGMPLPPDQRCKPDEGFVALFNGTLEGWREKPGTEGHWKASDWELAYDGGGDHLWSEREFGDFELICDWRWTRDPKDVKKSPVPLVRPDGTSPTGEDGKPKMVEVDDYGDSGIYLRGNDKSQVNIWCWPVGSGEVYGYRTDINQSAAVRQGVTPTEKADAPPGQWNRFRIRMQGDRLTVNLNGKTVIDDAQLPGVPRKGPIALQSHGSPIEFANIYVRELPGDRK
jgi:hypothetical protein